MTETSSSAPATDHSVIMLSGDLMFASRVKSAAQNAGLQFQLGGALPAGDLAAVRYVILDLSTRGGMSSAIAGQCAERCPNARLIAYGPHVHVEKLQAAREAGIGMVITNGQFNAMLSTMFSSPPQP